jgi:hypothetical protein
MAKKYMKKYSIALSIKEMQIPIPSHSSKNKNHQENKEQ